MQTETLERSSPPKPQPRKETPINKQFEDKAKDLVRGAMKHRSVDIETLHGKLSDMGVEISKGGLANKISRGGFSSAFLLQCLEALEIDVSAIPKS